MAVAIRASFRPGVDPEAVSLATTAGALAVCLVLAAPFLGGLTWHGVWPFLVAGLVAPGLSQVLFGGAIEAVGASRTAILVGVSPLLSALFAISLLGEPVRAGLVFGRVGIVGGAVALVSPRSATARLTAAGATAGVLAATLISTRDNVVRWADTGNDVPGVVAATGCLVSATALIATLLLARRRPLFPASLRPGPRPPPPPAPPPRPPLPARLRLLGGHRDPGELLVGRGREPPQPLRRVLVDVVERVREEREQQAERAREHEGDEEVDGFRGRAQHPRHVLEHRPPDEAASQEVAHVLDVQERARVPERGVVRPRQVPCEVDGEPDRQRDERARQRAHGRRPREPRGERGGEAGDEERGRPLREHDVLEQVHRQQVPERERLDRRGEDGKDQELAGEEGRASRSRRREPAQRDEVRDREGGDEHEHLGVPLPGVRLHGPTLPA